MNRKLVNGLLLLSIATVGCGTFTSCKDTDEDFKNEVLVDQAKLRDELLKKIDEAACKCDPTLKAQLEALKTWVGYAEGKNFGDVVWSSISSKLDDYLKTGDLDELKDALALANAEIGNINDRLNKLITSMEVNQTYNHMFGTINLPVGLQSNILASYYYLANQTVKFPALSTTTEVGSPEDLAKVAAALIALAPAQTTYNAGEVYMDEFKNNNNLGQLYVNINPNNIDFTGANLKLVKSNGEEAPVVLNSAKSEEVLNFGFTRADNAFYRVDANIDPAQAPEIALHIEDALKGAVKDALKNPSKQSLVQLGKAILDQMDGFLPAYGLKAPWTVEVKDAEGNVSYVDYATFSKYEIAATTLHPLSYETLSDISTSKRLPTFDPLSETFNNFFNDIRNDIKFDLKIDKIEPLDIEFKINKFTVEDQYLVIEIPEINVGGTTNKTESTKIYLSYDKGTGTLQPVTDGSVQTGALNKLIDSIVDSVNTLLTGNGDPLSDETKNSIQYQVQNNILAKVNSMITDINNMLVGDGTSAHPGINGQINSQINEILDKIQNQLAGKLGTADKLVDKYNALANKINSFLANPNHYLQVAMAYEDGNGDLHMLSNNENVPSQFVNGNGATELFATSYTAEIAAPSFKKYIAITKATKDDGTALDIKTANQAAGLNQVFPGRQQRIAVKGLQSGVTYEILYSSLDYRGKTSSRVYYLHVK